MKLIFCTFIIFGITSACKQRQLTESETKDFAFRKTNGQLDLLNAHQLTYVSELAYKAPHEIEAFTRQFEYTLHAAKDVNETFYFLISNPQYIILAFRGTEKNVEDWRTDFKLFKKSFRNGFVHCGFCEAYGNVNQEIRSQVLKLLAEAPKEFYITGHSLGGALGNIAALDLTEIVREYGFSQGIDYFKNFSVTGLYTYGAPKVFDIQGRDYINTIVRNHYRFIHGEDIVVKVPFDSMGYSHAGHGFHFRNTQRQCQLIDQSKVATSKSQILFPGWKLFGEFFQKFSVKDHSLENYRRCFIEGFSDP